VLLFLAACHAPKPRAPLVTPSGAPMRLGWVTWSDVNEIVYCNQRLDDNGIRVGVLGPCWHEVAGEPPKKMLSWLNAGRPDATRASVTHCFRATRSAFPAHSAPKLRASWCGAPGETGTIMDRIRTPARATRRHGVVRALVLASLAAWLAPAAHAAPCGGDAPPWVTMEVEAARIPTTDRWHCSICSRRSCR